MGARLAAGWSVTDKGVQQQQLVAYHMIDISDCDDRLIKYNPKTTIKRSKTDKGPLKGDTQQRPENYE